jgi:alkyldihydroxyacetonephosphate synthase
VATATSRLKHWGWGRESGQLTREQLEAAAPGIRERLGFGGEEVEEPVPLEAVRLPPTRVEPPASLAAICHSDPYERTSHALGKAYRDVVRGFRGRFDHPPDVVARPTEEADVARILDWCAAANLAAIPYGGGTSVVGGVEPRLGDAYAGVVSIDMRGLREVLEVDETARAARIQAGAVGPALEDQLRPHGLTLRHFPQSFEFSTLGGWIATRAGGHFATLMTHIDDLVESVRAITPAGEWESRRLPGSGAGPSPDRMLIGSEGTLGIVTEAWVRLQLRQRWKLSCGVAFDDFLAAAAAVRELSQSGLHPSNCRLLDATESEVTHAGPPGKALLVLGFESAHHPVDDPMKVAIEAVRDHGGEPGDVSGGRSGEPPPQPRRGAARENAPAEGEEGSDPVGAWRHAFLAAPYLRDTFVAVGVLSDTFETAITWDRFEEFHSSVIEGARRGVAAACGAAPDGDDSPRLSCRFTHVYPDGPAPYYTVLAPAKRGGEVEQWDEIKAAASEAVIAAGGTITHHHAIGRDHRPWYDRQRPDRFADALRAAKGAVDPAGILNPGVLIDP